MASGASAASAAAPATGQGTDMARLCYQYLVRAVCVHPATNADEDATETFIHAARCWLQSTAVAADGSLPFSPQFVTDPDLVNIDLAYVIFEYATTVCINEQDSPLVGFTMGKRCWWADHEELAHVLNEAQCLLRKQQESDAWASIRSAANGVAFSAVLWACGAVASQHGWDILGSLTRRAAMFQGIGQSAAGSMAVLRHPRVREQCEGPLSSIYSGLNRLSNCLTPGLKEREEVEEQLTTGCLVTISGLRTALELNGRDAEVLGVDERSGRYKVCILSSEGNVEGHQHTGATVKLIKVKLIICCGGSVN